MLWVCTIFGRWHSYLRVIFPYLRKVKNTILPYLRVFSHIYALFSHISAFMIFLPIFPCLRVIFPYLRVFEILHIFPYLRAFFIIFPISPRFYKNTGFLESILDWRMQSGLASKIAHQNFFWLFRALLIGIINWKNIIFWKVFNIRIISQSGPPHTGKSSSIWL
jgi:hypothetical protein